MLSLPGGKGLHSLVVFVRAGCPWRTEKLAVRAGEVPRAGCWHGSGKGIPGVMAGGCRGASGIPSLLPVLNSLTAGSGGAGDLENSLSHVPSGTMVVLDGDKSHSPPHSSSPHLANCLSSTFLAYLPTPRELWDDGRPHVGQRPAWHCPSQGLDPAK